MVDLLVTKLHDAHFMTMLPDVPVDAGSLRFALDYVGMEFHGDAHSHIDALCHVLYGGCSTPQEHVVHRVVYLPPQTLVLAGSVLELPSRLRQ